jgi:hypothetical protein
MGQMLLTSAVEGTSVPVDTPFATFTPSDPNTAITATIDWGDGSSSEAAVRGTSASLTVLTGPDHTYADEGNYQASVTITYSAFGNPAQTISGSVAVADADVFTPHDTSFAAESPLWVNKRNTRTEYFTSDIPSITDIARTSRNVRVVPGGDMASATLAIRRPSLDPSALGYRIFC